MKSLKYYFSQTWTWIIFYIKLFTCMKTRRSFPTPMMRWPFSLSPRLTWLQTAVTEQEGLNCRQVTPHLGYLTNWHSRTQSVKHSLSNTLSEGPDHRAWLCREIKQTPTWSKAWNEHVLWNVWPYRPAFSRGALTSSSSSSSSARVGRCSPLTVMTPCQDGPFDHWATALQRGSQNKEDNCKVSAQEICGNKVSTCHSCEMLLKAHSSSDNGSLR